MSDATERIGNDERESAVTALRLHHAAGRLTSAEYEDRSLQVRQAKTWDELAPLFADLPRDAADPADVAKHPEPQQQWGLLPEPWASWVMSLTPFAALLLFFTTGHHWQWFLAIPIVGLLMYGPNGQGHCWHGHRSRQQRNRRNY